MYKVAIFGNPFTTTLISKFDFYFEIFLELNKILMDLFQENYEYCHLRQIVDQEAFIIIVHEMLGMMNNEVRRRDISEMQLEQKEKHSFK